MSDKIHIVTNFHRREVIEAWELSESERAKFDYLDWSAIERGEDSASFVRYKGELHDLGEFASYWGLSRGSGLPKVFKGWHAYRSDSFFSGMLIRFVDDSEYVIVGWYWC